MVIPYQDIIDCFNSNGYSGNSITYTLLNDEASTNSVVVESLPKDGNAVELLQTAINEFCQVYGGDAITEKGSECFISREHYENTLFYTLITSSGVFLCILFCLVRLCCCRR